MSTPLQFAPRAKVQMTDCARRRHWLSACGRYRITESKSLFGFPTVYWALVRREFGWDSISKHRLRSAALKACQEHASREAEPVLRPLFKRLQRKS